MSSSTSYPRNQFSLHRKPVNRTYIDVKLLSSPVLESSSTFLPQLSVSPVSPTFASENSPHLSFLSSSSTGDRSPNLSANETSDFQWSTASSASERDYSSPPSSPEAGDLTMPKLPSSLQRRGSKINFARPLQKNKEERLAPAAARASFELPERSALIMDKGVVGHMFGRSIQKSRRTDTSSIRRGSCDATSVYDRPNTYFSTYSTESRPIESSSRPASSLSRSNRIDDFGAYTEYYYNSTPSAGKGLGLDVSSIHSKMSMGIEDEMDAEDASEAPIEETVTEEIYERRKGIDFGVGITVDLPPTRRASVASISPNVSQRHSLVISTPPISPLPARGLKSIASSASLRPSTGSVQIASSKPIPVSTPLADSISSLDTTATVVPKSPSPAPSPTRKTHHTAASAHAFFVTVGPTICQPLNGSSSISSTTLPSFSNSLSMRKFGARPSTSEADSSAAYKPFGQRHRRTASFGLQELRELKEAADIMQSDVKKPFKSSAISSSASYNSCSGSRSAAPKKVQRKPVPSALLESPVDPILDPKAPFEESSLFAPLPRPPLLRPKSANRQSMFVVSTTSTSSSDVESVSPRSSFHSASFSDVTSDDSFNCCGVLGKESAQSSVSSDDGGVPRTPLNMSFSEFDLDLDKLKATTAWATSSSSVGQHFLSVDESQVKETPRYKVDPALFADGVLNSGPKPALTRRWSPVKATYLNK